MVVARTPTARVTLLDADALAVAAARVNVPEAVDVLLSDAWVAVPSGSSFDVIVSNPPVHKGRCQDFSVLESLVNGLGEHLSPGGTAYFVTQSYVPAALVGGASSVGKDGDGDSASQRVDVLAFDGRFTVWRVGSARGASPTRKKKKERKRNKSESHETGSTSSAKRSKESKSESHETGSTSSAKRSKESK
jgi:hypothetical protein